MEVQKVMDLKTIKEMEVDLGERDKQLASLKRKCMDYVIFIGET